MAHGSLHIRGIGQVLGGRYRLQTLVGVGASAMVYRASDETLRREVAVKVLHANLAGDPRIVQRFLAEAQAAGSLNHPNIVSIFDWGTDHGGAALPYIVMEYLGSGSLRDMIDAGHRLTLSQALVVGLDAAKALEYADARRLVHRDIKPANLMFGSGSTPNDTRLRIADFGLARVLDDGTSGALTERDGIVLGTAKYASPEQVQGKILSGKSDIYSLALSLVEAVTGEVPFASSSPVDMLTARVNSDVVIPAELGALIDVLSSSSCKDPAGRLDAAGLGRQLFRCAANLPAPTLLPVRLIDLTGGNGLGEIDSSGDATTVMLVDATSIAEDPAAPVDPERAAPDMPASASRVVPPPTLREPNMRLRTIRIALAVAVAFALLTVAFFTIRSAYKSSRPKPIPTHLLASVVSLSEDAARQQLLGQGMVVLVNYRYQDGTTAGVVVEQSSPAGFDTREGSAISIVVSRGNELTAVPTLNTMTQEQASAAIVDAKFVVGTVTPKNDETIAAGVVVDWSPKGIDLEHGKPIDLVVSSGPAPRAVPQLVGKTVEEATAALTPLNLTLAPDPAQVFSDTVAAGLIISADQAENAIVAKGAVISVVVSKGQDLVTVPDLGGKSYSQAIKAITDAGLSLGEGRGALGGVVIDQSLTPNTAVKRGTAINVRFG